MKTYNQRVEALEQNLHSLYSVIWGQCSETMKSKLRMHKDYDTKSRAFECSWILKEIRGITFRFEGQRSLVISLLEAQQSLINYRQGPNESLSDYLDTFKAKVEVYEHYGGAIGSGKGYIREAATHFGVTMGNDGYKREAKAHAVAMMFLRQSDKHRFEGLNADLANNFSRGVDQYPRDITGAYNLLVNYKPPPGSERRQQRNRNAQQQQQQQGNSAARTGANDDEDAGPAMTFAQNSRTTPGTDGVLHSHITCFECQTMGHYASACPNSGGGDAASGDVQLMQLNTSQSTSYTSNFSFTQRRTAQAHIPNTWVLLDSQSTVSVFNNPLLVRNIRESGNVLEVVTNGGIQKSTQIADIPNFGTVWFNPKSIANILSLAEVCDICKVTMNSEIEQALVVHKSDGNTMKFRRFKTGLYFFDAADDIQKALASDKSAPGHPSSTAVSPYSLLQTVEDNKSKFSAREVEAADKARALYRMVGRPSQVKFEELIAKNLIVNCPITVADAKRAAIIYGPDPAFLKGKATKQKPSRVNVTAPLEIPRHIADHHRDVVMCADVFHVQGLMFLHTISRKLNFRTVALIPSREKLVLLEELNAVIELYHNRTFRITDVHADNEFECLRQELAQIRLNIVAQDDHVPEIERSIRTVKECLRVLVHGMPFKRIPKLLLVELVRSVIKNLNILPAKQGVCKDVNPRSVVAGLPNPDYNQLKIEIGQYCTVFEDNNPTNTTRRRMVDAIALNQTGNAQGTYHFMSLASGKKIARRQFTPLPMTNAVIRRVEAIAEAQGQPHIQSPKFLKFEWGPNDPILDETDEDEAEDDSSSTGSDSDYSSNEEEEENEMDHELDQDLEPIVEETDLDEADSDNDTVSGDDNPEEEKKRRTTFPRMKTKTNHQKTPTTTPAAKSKTKN